MAGFADTVSKLLECSICLECLSSPRTLPCEHSFCAQCLADLVKDQIIEDKDGIFAPKSLVIVCPNCNCKHKNIASVFSCKAALFVKQVVDAVSTKEAKFVIKSSEECSVCHCESPCYECIKCTEKVCESCHNVKEPCRSISAECSSTEHTFTKLKSINACPKHCINEDLFCTDCAQVICLDCFLIEHRKHKIKKTSSMKAFALSMSSKCQLIIDEIFRNQETVQGLLEEEREKLRKKEEKALDNLKKVQLNVHKYVFHIFEKERMSIKDHHNNLWQDLCFNIHANEGKEVADVEEFMELKKVLNSQDVYDSKFATCFRSLKKKLAEVEVKIGDSKMHVSIAKSHLQAFPHSFIFIGPLHRLSPEDFDSSKAFQPGSDLLDAYDKCPRSNKIEQFLNSII
eukprot:gene15230-16805_t